MSGEHSSDCQTMAGGHSPDWQTVSGECSSDWQSMSGERSSDWQTMSGENSSDCQTMSGDRFSRPSGDKLPVTTDWDMSWFQLTKTCHRIVIIYRCMTWWSHETSHSSQIARFSPIFSFCVIGAIIGSFLILWRS